MKAFFVKLHYKKYGRETWDFHGFSNSDDLIAKWVREVEQDMKHTVNMTVSTVAYKVIDLDAPSSEVVREPTKTGDS